MKILRILLFPLVPIYYGVTWLRNMLYDNGILRSERYDFPVICVGNLSTGGTGKTPMIEYLVRLLKEDYNVAILSRGYKRKTSGFVLADSFANPFNIGDEPYQFYRKFKGILVAVDENRKSGIHRLRQLNTPPDVILLDDAYQHRKVQAQLNVLLTPYYNLYSNDFVLPTGNLREPKSGAQRADIIIVTKCPQSISSENKNVIKQNLKVSNHQKLFFSSIRYSDKVFSKDQTLDLKDLSKFILVTGIANAKPMVDYLKSKQLNFTHFEFKDHYEFNSTDIKKFDGEEPIITTEKDYVRLEQTKASFGKLYYLPITFTIDNAEVFQEAVLSSVKG